MWYNDLAQVPAEALIPQTQSADYQWIDLSVAATKTTDVANLLSLHQFVEQARQQKIGIGGYLEQRALYASSTHFAQEARDIHLGMDFWAPAGTPIATPLPGRVHSFRENTAYRDYGPTIILAHNLPQVGTFYTLYGHLTAWSLTTLKPNMELAAGTIFTAIGEPTENGQWPPHLHFQIIRDLQDYVGDYPGVTTKAQCAAMQVNCPDPNYLLQIPKYA